MKKWISTICLLSTLIAAESRDTSVWTVRHEPQLHSPPMHIKMNQWVIESGDWFKITNTETHKSYWVHKNELTKKKMHLSSKYHKITARGPSTQPVTYRIHRNLPQTIDHKVYTIINKQNKGIQHKKLRFSEGSKSSFLLKKIRHDVRHRITT